MAGGRGIGLGLSQDDEEGYYWGVSEASQREILSTELERIMTKIEAIIQKIFLSRVDEAIRIRNDERGEGAL